MYQATSLGRRGANLSETESLFQKHLPQPQEQVHCEQITCIPLRLLRLLLFSVPLPCYLSKPLHLHFRVTGMGWGSTSYESEDEVKVLLNTNKLPINSCFSEKDSDTLKYVCWPECKIQCRPWRSSNSFKTQFSKVKLREFSCDSSFSWR